MTQKDYSRLEIVLEKPKVNTKSSQRNLKNHPNPVRHTKRRFLWPDSDTIIKTWTISSRWDTNIQLLCSKMERKIELLLAESSLSLPEGEATLIPLRYHHLKWELLNLKWFWLAPPPGMQIREKLLASLSLIRQNRSSWKITRLVHPFIFIILKFRATFTTFTIWNIQQKQFKVTTVLEEYHVLNQTLIHRRLALHLVRPKMKNIKRTRELLHSMRRNLWLLKRNLLLLSNRSLNNRFNCKKYLSTNSSEQKHIIIKHLFSIYLQIASALFWGQQTCVRLSDSREVAKTFHDLCTILYWSLEQARGQRVW